MHKNTSSPTLQLLHHTYIHTDLASMLEALPPPPQLLLVSDTHTLNAALTHLPMLGDYVNTIQIHGQHALMPASPHALLHHAEAIAQRACAQNISHILCIGSGTLNDICKYAAHSTHIPYSIIATAPSMNGYISATASLAKQGAAKTSYPATPPAHLLRDDILLATAPLRLRSAGYADLLCRACVQVDAYAGHLRCNSAYSASWFDPIIAMEPALYSASAAIHAGTPQAVALLMDGLLISSAIMANCSSSIAASQGEHAIAHVLEMLYPERMQHYTHGELIAVTTCTMLFVQSHYTESSHSPFNPHALRAALKTAGCPTTAQDIGLSDAEYARALPLAASLRPRYTLLEAWLAEHGTAPAAPAVPALPE